MRVKLEIALLSGALLAANLMAVDVAQAQTVQKKVKPAEKPQKKPAKKVADQLHEARQLAVHSGSALVIGQDGGDPLYQKNANVVVPIASITKVMTAMVVLDSIPDLQAPITVSDDDVDYLRGSRSRLHVGSVITRETALLLA
jgi:D-alanyl-D-alanine endopeptidase (penicillin-binding protein 7)